MTFRTESDKIKAGSTVRFPNGRIRCDEDDEDILVLPHYLRVCYLKVSWWFAEYTL
jgi:hypothetical protein